MLRFLRIEHLAVIDEVQVDFEPGLNVLTGETGAGKSMLVEAVGLLMGGRAAADLVRTGESQASVQAVFEVGPRRTYRPPRHQRTGAQPRLHRRRAGDGDGARRSHGAARRAPRTARASDASRSAKPPVDPRRVRRPGAVTRRDRRGVSTAGSNCSPSSTRSRWTSARRRRGSTC